jgi:hypothetical protein
VCYNVFKNFLENTIIPKVSDNNDKEKIKANKLEIIKQNLEYDLEAYEKEYYERIMLKPYLICKIGNFYYPLYCFFYK